MEVRIELLQPDLFLGCLATRPQLAKEINPFAHRLRGGILDGRAFASESTTAQAFGKDHRKFVAFARNPRAAASVFRFGMARKTVLVLISARNACANSWSARHGRRAGVAVALRFRAISWGIFARKGYG